jgi:hypothetical protein
MTISRYESERFETELMQEVRKGRGGVLKKIMTEVCRVCGYNM